MFPHLRELAGSGLRYSPVAVVRGTPDGTKLIPIQDRIPLHTQLMGTKDMVHTVEREEFLHDRGTKRVPSASRTDRKVFLLRVGIGPNQICHGPLVRDLSEAIDHFDLIYMVNRRTETAMNTEDGVIDHNAKGQEVEHVGEILPDGRRAVFPRALQVEPVRLWTC